MTCKEQPKLYYTITSINDFDGTPTTIGIFDSMRSVSFRLQRMYSSCGDEYRIECFHVSSAEEEAEALTEQQVTRAKYRREEEMKEARLKEWEKYKEKEEDQMIEDCKNAQPDEEQAS